MKSNPVIHGPFQILEKDPTANVTKITSLIQKHLTTATVDMNLGGAEMSFILPEEDGSQFTKLLRAVEDNAATVNKLMFCF